MCTTTKIAGLKMTLVRHVDTKTAKDTDNFAIKTQPLQIQLKRIFTS